MSSRRGRNIRRFAGVMTALVIGVTLCAPTTVAAQAVLNPTVPSPTMHGYAAGPAQHNGTAAGRSHYVPASATQTGLRMPGHSAPKPDLAQPAMARAKLVQTGETKTSPGHIVSHEGATPGTLPGIQATPQGTIAPALQPAATVTYDASYSVAAACRHRPDGQPDRPRRGDPDQHRHRDLVRRLRSWREGLPGKQHHRHRHAADDRTGRDVPDHRRPRAVGDGGKRDAEQNPGTYTICWDMRTPSGAYFSASGGSTYCAPYTVKQYPAQVTEQSPLPGTSENTQTPQLSASATVIGGYPVDPALWFAFEVVTQASNGPWTVVQSSGWVAGNGNTWTVPKPLTWGSTYYWQVAVSDASTPPSVGSTSLTWTTPISFVVGDAQPAVWNRFGPVQHTDDGNPVMTSDLGSYSSTGSGKMVDPKTANVSQQVTDASVAGAGSLSILRTYNSLDPRTSQAFGAGWSSAQDMELAPDPDGTGALILTLADGQQYGSRRTRAADTHRRRTCTRWSRRQRRRLLGDGPDGHHVQLRPGQRV